MGVGLYCVTYTSDGGATQCVHTNDSCWHHTSPISWVVRDPWICGDSWSLMILA